MSDGRSTTREHTAWVTGGSSGIGAAVVPRLSDDGSQVTILDLQPPGHDVPWHAVDLGDAESVTRGLDGLSRTTGWPDQLVLCAGIAGESHGIGDYPLDLWSRSLAVNLTSAMLILRQVFPEMCQRGSGRIVTISSGMAIRAGPGAAGYATSKAGLIALTKVVAMEGHRTA
jgi:NAD(P)-dependent dehydrogenase (short-subunit alcohol dehydrogenase family)